MSQTRSAVENRRMIANLAPRYQTLTKERIRAEGEVERLQRELVQAEAEAKEVFKTTDLAKIEQILLDNQAEATQAVDSLRETIEEIETRLTAVAREA